MGLNMHSRNFQPVITDRSGIVEALHCVYTAFAIYCYCSTLLRYIRRVSWHPEMRGTTVPSPCYWISRIESTLVAALSMPTPPANGGEDTVCSYPTCRGAVVPWYVYNIPQTKIPNPTSKPYPQQLSAPNSHHSLVTTVPTDPAKHM